jgi:tetratricopeptide (TPR) repeat protein
LHRRKTERGKRDGIEHFLVDAIEAFEKHDYAEAIRKCQLITQAYPEHSLCYLLLGRAYIKEKEYERALEALHKHLAVVPKSVEAMIYLGLAYYESNDLSHAQARFEEAMKLRAESLFARESLVITKIAAGRLEDALDDLILLQKEHPRDRTISELLILTLGRLGKWEDAKQHSLHMSGSQTLPLII